MTNKISGIIRHEIVSISVGLIITFFAFVILAVWRIFDTETFSFLQIIAVIFLVGLALYAITFLFDGKISKLLWRRELVAIAISFTIMSFFILNIDRSRSFFLIKWIAHNEPAGISVKQIAISHNLSKVDIHDLKQRIREQMSSGTVESVSGHLHLTSRGIFLAKLFDFIAKVENLKGYTRG